MNPTPFQPADETPLPGFQPGSSIPAVAAGMPGLGVEMQDARSAVVDQARQDIINLKNQLADAYKNVAVGTLSDVVALQQPLGTAYGDIVGAAGKQLKKVRDQLEGGYTSLWQGGVSTPIGMNDMLLDLEDPTGQRIAARFDSLKGGGDTSLPPVPPPIVIDPTVGTSGWVEPDVGTGGQISCRPGWVLVWMQVGDTMRQVCRPGLPPVSPPPFVPPPYLPPSPPPPFGPPPPPPPPFVPPPPPSVPTVCDPPPETVKVQCFKLQPAPLKLHFYVTVDCADCNRPEACVWSGVKPPTVFVGILLPDVFDTPPSQETLELLARNCAAPFLPPPPPPPPLGPPALPPPPPSPPISPPAPLCIENAGDYAQDLAGPGLHDWREDPESCNVEQLPDPVRGGWNQYAQCRTIHDGVLKELQSTNSPIASNLDKPSSWTDFAKVWAWALNPVQFAAGMISPGDRAENIDVVKRVAGEVLDAGFEAVEAIIQRFSAKTTTNIKAVIKIGAGLALGAKVEALTGFPLSYVMMSQTYMFQYANPQFIPGQAELDNLFLFDRISNAEWECYTKANGNLPDLFRPIRNAKQQQPGLQDLLALYRRGGIDGPAELFKRARGIGVLSAEHVKEMLRVTESVPQPPDIIRFMVRDVFDPDTVKKYNLDDEFTEKYTKDAERLGLQVGLATETANLEWRAHWNVPSDTSLYAFIQRLRPDRTEIKDWDAKAREIGPDGAAALLGPRPPVFTMEDLIYALKVNDNLPNFVPHLAAIQYRPITNTDASRMYQIGLIDPDQFNSRVQDNGYTAADAKEIVRFYQAEKTRRISTDSGVWPTRKIVRAFKAGLIDREKADDLLGAIVLDAGTRKTILDGARFEAEVETRAAQVKSLKKRYMYGEFSTNDLTNFLTQIGIDATSVQTTAQQWEYEKLSRAKEPRVAWLCRWFTSGFITWQDYYDRLVRLGYNADDTLRIIKLCQTDDLAKKAAAAVKAAEKNRREVERALKEEKNGLAKQLNDLKQAVKVEQDKYNNLVLHNAGH